VSERAGRWFVSVQVEKEIPDPKASYQPVVGVDLGILALATISDGTRIENPRALKRDLRKIKRLQRVVSRRQKGSANRGKAVRQLARAHLRVANVRKNALHQVTSLLAKNQVSSCIGRPECEWDGEEPSPGAGDHGCGIL
jgi:putative transposase